MTLFQQIKSFYKDRLSNQQALEIIREASLSAQKKYSEFSHMSMDVLVALIDSRISYKFDPITNDAEYLFEITESLLKRARDRQRNHYFWELDLDEYLQRILFVRKNLKKDSDLIWEISTLYGLIPQMINSICRWWKGERKADPTELAKIVFSLLTEEEWEPILDLGKGYKKAKEDLMKYASESKCKYSLEKSVVLAKRCLEDIDRIPRDLARLRVSCMFMKVLY